jgi:uncharacterized protein YqgV (UPF0045/DUF77 family)
MTKLYEISESLRGLASIDPEDESMELAIRDTMEAVQGEFDEKAKAVASVILNMDSDADAIQVEIDRLTARKKAIQNRQEGIREYLRTNMEACGISKITHPLFSITLAKGREIAVIDDPGALPDDLVYVKTEVRPEKAEILKLLKEGAEVPGAHIERSQSSIRIK